MFGCLLRGNRAFQRSTSRFADSCSALGLNPSSQLPIELRTFELVRRIAQKQGNRLAGSANQNRLDLEERETLLEAFHSKD